MLYAQVVPVLNVLLPQRKEMFLLLEQYYEKVEWNRFLSDLDNKDDVILLIEKQTEKIKGFSTLKNMTINNNGRFHYGVFSGDTVIDRDYWGQRLLGKKFLQYLFKQKFKHPFKPFYWILVSKGYKTYLLMANNFQNHYPRYEKQTPSDVQQLIDSFAHNLFGEVYEPESGLIQFSQSLGQLRPGIADIPSQVQDNPRIDYFLERNPEWSKGTELMCIARMSWGMPVYYQCKSLWKRIRRAFYSTKTLETSVHKK
jgi:hypothetical protein